MNSAGSSPGKITSFQPRWSHRLGGNPLGLVLAREKNWLLAWDHNRWLYLLDESGQPQGQSQFPGVLAGACCADDGSAFAAVGKRGEICWLAPDLMPRWQQTLSAPALAATMDPFGRYLAVSDTRGRIHLFKRSGVCLRSFAVPRPLHHLAFVPAARVLVGSADYGLVLGFDLEGKILWRDGLVANAGSLAVNGDGSHLLIACFSEGLQRYDLAGKNLGRWSREPCRLVAMAFTGRFILAAGLDNRLVLLDQNGETLFAQDFDKSIRGIALSALGDYGMVALTEGPIIKLEPAR